MNHTAFIALGSNLGDSVAECRGALKEIASLPETKVVKASSLFRSEPLLREGGKRDVPWYVNAVCKVETMLDSETLLIHLCEIEKRHGRKEKSNWEPRRLDLDLVAYDDLVMSKPALQLPHPGAAGRRFVLEPLCEIEPEWIHPESGETARTLLGRLESPLKVERL